MGILIKWRKLVPKREGHLMPFIVCRTSSGRIDVGIQRNVIFFTPAAELRSPPRLGIVKNCKYLVQFILTEGDKKQS